MGAATVHSVNAPLHEVAYRSDAMYRVARRRAIIDRKALVRELDEQLAVTPYAADTRGNFLQVFKAALYGGVAEIRRRFEDEGIDGGEVVQANAHLVDQLMRCLFDFALDHVHPTARRPQGQGLCMVATGGYGRAELSPFSDIDLMFLLPDGDASRYEPVVEFMLYSLWDMGLKVGHATRTIDDCLARARGDLTIRTSVLESRWLWGNRDLHRRFNARFFKEVVAGSEVAFVEAKLADRDARHDRMGDSRYVLEPHIKEGKGGLRDLQTLFWLAKYIYKVRDMSELVQRGVFTDADARHFHQTQNFLWTVRCHLHYVTGRPEERLTFDVQDVISRRLGYRDSNGQRGVERFMRHYFLITKAVGDLTRVLCAVLEENQKKRRRLFFMPWIPLLKRRPEGFVLDGDRISVEADDAFRKDPVKLLKLFAEAQRLGRDIHPHALRLVGQDQRLVDQAVRDNPDANRLFMDMLTSENDPETTLRRLNEAGILGRFISDFGRVVAQMQYDMYHVHTVDEHTIHAIGILHRIEQRKLAEAHPTATAVMREIRPRRALYLAMLLHDIGKGRGGDHSEIGAEIAQQLAPRLGLDEWETETVSWLVLHHLLMSRTAFKRDIDNAKTISDFVAVVQSPERLRMLLVLTGADIDAVGPGIWNAWKETLLSELYYRALERMEMTGGQPLERRTARVERAKERLRDALADWDAEVLDAYVARGYPDYWVAFDTATQVRHFELMRAADAEGRRLHVETIPVAARGATELLVYAPDHAGLFARIAGAIAIAGASIVDAKAVTLANSMALDTFFLQDINGKPFDEAERLERLRQRVAAALSGQIYPAREFARKRRAALPSRTGVFKVQPAVIVDNDASRTHTVLEVNGRDRVGFLYDVTSTLTELGLQISSAHVSTFGERAVDVFYVKDVFGLKIDDPAKLRRIHWKLREALEEPERPATPSSSAAE